MLGVKVGVGVEVAVGVQLGIPLDTEETAAVNVAVAIPAEEDMFAVWPDFRMGKLQAANKSSNTRARMLLIRDSDRKPRLYYPLINGDAASSRNTAQ